MDNMKKIDCTKITTLDEVKLILDALELRIDEHSEHYESLKHLTIEEPTPYRENWSPDWKGDPDDPNRWNGW